MRIGSLLFIYLILFNFSFLKAQTLFHLSNAEADCETAIDISGLSIIKATAPVGTGRWNEIQSPKKSLYAFQKEHHTVWYKFTVAQNCRLAFTIIPDNPKDDYDFILYKADGEKTCRSIRKGELKPVRTNISRTSETNQGKTGLNLKGKSAYIHEGKGNNWSLPLDIKAGEVYYLVLDNVYNNGKGHTIKFFFTNCHDKIIDVTKPFTVNINVRDSKTKGLIRAQIMIIDEDKAYPNYDTIYNKKASSMFMSIKPDQYYAYEVWADQYLREKGIFKIDSNPNHRTKQIDIDLIKVKIGDSFELQDLYFVGGKATIIRKSYPALRKLLAIMKNNPSLEINIMGHVNLPNKSKAKHTEEYYNNLSIARAKTVYDYLNRRGIDSSRMKYQGFGYSKMIFPEAETPKQMQRNRRVVVKITNL
jgi:outer membrane protein OmpA-like peptidoglycan-associated protein